MYIMKKNQYIRPEMEIHAVAPQTMLALSAPKFGEADPDIDVLVNERDGKFTDVWGNDL